MALTLAPRTASGGTTISGVLYLTPSILFVLSKVERLLRSRLLASSYRLRSCLLDSSSPRSFLPLLVRFPLSLLSALFLASLAVSFSGDRSSSDLRKASSFRGDPPIFFHVLCPLRLLSLASASLSSLIRMVWLLSGFSVLSTRPETRSVRSDYSARSEKRRLSGVAGTGLVVVAGWYKFL